MSGVREAIVGQFRKPRGVFGRLVGWIMATRPSNRQRNAWTIDLLDPQPGETILEIGCGPGYALAFCAARRPDIDLTGLDHSATMLDQTRRRLQAADPKTKWRLEAGTHDRLAEWPQTFDAIYSVNVVQFLPDMRAGFDLILGALKPGGRVATTYQPRHKAPTRQDALDQAAAIKKAMEKAGFAGIESHVLELKPVPAVAVTGRKPM